MNIQPLFPIPLTTSELSRDFSSDEIAYVKAISLVNNVSNFRSSDFNILDDPKMLGIRDFIHTQLDEYCKNVLCNDAISLRITQSWINVTNPGQSHHQHTHPNSIVSGVFYFQNADNGNDGIRFYRSSNFYSLSVDPNFYNLYNSISWLMPARPKIMYLFPSTVPHDVPAVVGQTSRISLSFNTFIKGQLGDINGAYSLTL